MALPLLKGVDEGVQLLSLQLHHIFPFQVKKIGAIKGLD
jgi:hypothetical protein